MVVYCCVRGCSNNSKSKKKDPSSLLSFHAFPRNSELKSKWLKAIGRPNWVPPSYARICSMHFHHDQINYEGCRARIRDDDSIPTNNLPLNSNFEATNVEACRICLATDLKMYNLQDSHMSGCMDTVAGFNQNHDIEGLPQYVCYQCGACLIRYSKLVEKSMIAQATLLDIFAKNGQITTNLIKQLNRDKLNLKSSLNCCIMKNYNYYEYDEKENTTNNTNSTDCIDNADDNSLKNENEGKASLLNIKTDSMMIMIENAINEYKKEIKLNEEIDYDEDFEDGMNSPSADSLADNDINRTEDHIIVHSDMNRKRHKSEEGVIRKTPSRKKANGLTPDETHMQKYFDIVKLSLEEQVAEWKKAIARRVTSETIYECEVCFKIFAQNKTYRVHVSSHDPSRGKFECTVCKLRFKSDVLVKSHANRAHHKKFYCKTCPKAFNNVGVAKKHQRWHSGYKYACSSCPFTTRHESALGVHTRGAHAPAHACPVCGRACVSRRGLQLHTATAHRDVKETDITKAYRCEACDINFVSEGARRVHLLTSSQHKKTSGLCVPVADELRNTCSKCGVECASLGELVMHTRAEHPRANRKKWQGPGSYPTHCELCGETVSSRQSHWQHVRREHPMETDKYCPVVNAICDTCGKGFQNSTKLHLHQLRHRAPTVRCDRCPRLFYDKHALERHATTHTTSKPHQCRTCGRAFKLAGNLQRHSRVHTDVARYECSMCGKRFKHSSSVKLHVRTVHYRLPHPPRKKRSKTTGDDNACINNIERP